MKTPVQCRRSDPEPPPPMSVPKFDFAAEEPVANVNSAPPSRVTYVEDAWGRLSELVDGVMAQPENEGMIPSKNGLSIKQYIQSKPIKWGIKSFLQCESATGYIVNAEIYT